MIAEPAGIRATAQSAASPPVFVLTRDRVECLRALVGWFDERNCRVIVVDSASTNPELCDYLDSLRHTVIRLPFNAGHRAIWDLGILDSLGIEGRYVVTDPDVVPDPDCPDDVFEHLGELLDRFPDRIKAGLSLRIDDLPDRYAHRQAVIDWETPFWDRHVVPGAIDAPVDTTFALYQAHVRHYAIEPAIRTDAPYLARHLTWYVDSADLPADERYYRAHAEPSVANWAMDTLPEWLETGQGHPLR